MPIEKVGEACCGCGACAASCPQSCIEMVQNAEGFLYPTVRPAGCVHCGLCEKVCPTLSGGTADLLGAAAVKAEDAQVREKCSSGGLFYLLAQQILEEGGAVCGAAFRPDFRSVAHRIVERIEDLQPLLGSKYLQSRMNVYRELEAILRAGRPVLFSGTPCQVNGLKGYLQKDDPNLTCVSVICHGVPSEMLWDRYLAWQTGGNTDAVAAVNFRDKRYGIDRYGVAIRYRDGTDFFAERKDHPYLQLFLKDCALRPSCYGCPCKIHAVQSDITLGDLWGAAALAEDFDDQKGISAALIHTEKGRALLERVQGKAALRTVDPHGVIEHNPSAVRSPAKPKERETFYKDLQTLPYEKVKNKYGKTTLKQKAKRAVKRLLRVLKSTKE